jgi:TolB-like protein/DNA-binding winged helix-turn-helix (wHTH) protein/Tfp pilus assembly protein PilF
MIQTCVRFDEFELDTESCELLRAGQRVKLERIPLQLLALLLENPGKLVRREAIVERLWGGNVFVEAEHSVNTAVNKLRAILRDDPRNPRFIRTVVGQGYCFIAPVQVAEPAKTGSAVDSPAGPDNTNHRTGTNGHLDGTAGLEKPEEALPSDEPVAADVGTTAEPVASPAKETSTYTIRKPSHSKAWIIAGLAGSIAALLALTIYQLRQHERVAQSRPETAALQSVAVLPFRNLAQTPDEDYLADGLTDELTTNLARSTSLRVISQRSAMRYKDSHEPIQQIARSLNVDAVVEGSYLRADNRVRITVQLLDARDDRHLWAQMYDESDKHLLAMQDQVTEDIAQQVAIALGSSFTRSKLRAVNPQARDAYLRGRYFWNQRTLPAITTSVKYYTDAIRADPDYAEAYAALAEAYVLLGSSDDPETYDYFWKAQYAAERALDLDSSLGAAHTALGAIKVERDWDWGGAEEEYRRALQLSPADPTAHHWHSLHLSRMGRFNEAEAEIQRALALDPLSLIINTDAAETANWARDPQKALTRVDSVLALNPDFAGAHITKGEILEQLNQYEKAAAEFETGKRLLGGAAFLDAFRAHAMALGGKTADALKLVKQLEAEWPKNHVSGAYIALAYCGLHQEDLAMKWFEVAYQRRENGMGMIAIDPVYNGCRSDPRFTDLQRRMRLIHYH